MRIAKRLLAAVAAVFVIVTVLTACEEAESQDPNVKWRVIEVINESTYDGVTHRSSEEYVYDEHGKLIERIDQNDDQTTVYDAVCDEDGNVLMLTATRNDGSLIEEKYTYDENDNCLSESCYFDGTIRSEVTRKYNANGKVVEYTNTTHDPFSEAIFVNHETFEYDDDNRIVKITHITENNGELASCFIQGYVYEGGILSEIQLYSEQGEILTVMDVECDTQGNPIKMTSCDTDGNLIMIQRQEFDEAGNKTLVETTYPTGNQAYRIITKYKAFE